MTQPESLGDYDQALGKGADIPKLLAKCGELVERFQYDVAIKFCDRILERESHQLDALQMKATILIDIGEVEQAKETLLKAVEAQPDSGPEKYMALAQLCQGQEALQYFQRAIDIVNASHGEERQEMVTSIYCSLAELYMTDLCEETDAEGCCEKYVEAALKESPNSYEAFQTLANMRLSQNRSEEAAEALARSIQLWTLIPFESVEYPTYEFRLTCARLLVELGSLEIAKEILAVLSQEDDEILEVWYLLSLSHFSEQNFVASNEALENAERLVLSGGGFPELSEAMAELREALGSAEKFENMEDPHDNESDGSMHSEGEGKGESEMDVDDECEPN